MPDDVLKLVKENGGVVMVNFYSGLHRRPKAARATQKMFEVARELQEEVSRRRGQVSRGAMRAWEKEQPTTRPGSVHDVVDHIEHIIKVAGIDHVGLGSDFDGMNKLPKQLEDVSCYPYITQELLNRGYTREQIHKVLGGNLMRVFAAAEKVGSEMRSGK